MDIDMELLEMAWWWWAGGIKRHRSEAPEPLASRSIQYHSVLSYKTVPQGTETPIKYCFIMNWPCCKAANSEQPFYPSWRDQPYQGLEKMRPKSIDYGAHGSSPAAPYVIQVNDMPKLARFRHTSAMKPLNLCVPAEYCSRKGKRALYDDFSNLQE